MRSSRRPGLAVCAAAVCLAGTTASPATAARGPAWTKNCTELHKKYPDGLGGTNARDRVRGRTPPVTTFTVSDILFRTAMSSNRGLDRDKDGVACEKA